jgi:NAD(P)H dehydrogenase (quinone)
VHIVTTQPTLFISGAGGKLGRLVVELLLARGYQGKIIAGTRDPGKLADLKGVEVRHADFSDEDGLVKALSGADRLLLISTDTLGTRLALHKKAVAAALRAGIKEIAYTSMPTPEQPSAITFAPEHFGTEEAIKASGIPYTILRMTWYTENLLGSLPGALASGKWYSSAAGGRTGYVSRIDCARAAAGALLVPASNQTLTVTGPAALSNAEIAAIATKLTGKPIDVVEVDDASLAAGAKAAGVPDFVIDNFIVPFDRNAREGKVNFATDAVETLWGEKPQSVEAFLTANKAALTAPSAAAH